MAVATYPLDTICNLLDLSQRRVQQLSKEGVIPKAERGRYELVPAIRGYIRYLKERSITGDAKSDETIVSFDEARRRKISAEAEMAELALAVEQQKVVSIEETEKNWTEVLGAVRAKILSMPTVMASQVAVETDQKIVKELLTKKVEQALMELSAIEIKTKAEVIPSSKQSDATDGTTSTPDGKRVGRQRKKAVTRS